MSIKQRLRNIERKIGIGVEEESLVIFVIKTCEYKEAGIPTRYGPAVIRAGNRDSERLEPYENETSEEFKARVEERRIEITGRCP